MILWGFLTMIFPLHDFLALTFLRIDLYSLSDTGANAKIYSICPRYCTLSTNQTSEIIMEILDVNHIEEFFKDCSHPLTGSIINIGSYGINPYVYRDENKEVIKDNNGVPLGSNGGIASALSKTYKFKIIISDFFQGPILNFTTKKWSGIFGEVNQPPPLLNFKKKF